MKQSILIGFAALLILSSSSCEPRQASNRQMAALQEKMMQEANAQAGMPAIVNFQEKKLAKMIFELRDRADLICYAYIVSQYTGKPFFVGKCMGYGLPYSVQYTNPEVIAASYQGGYAILPQADPNGLFMPTGLSATWLMMIDPETNEPKPVYFEPEIIVSPFKLH